MVSFRVWVLIFSLVCAALFIAPWNAFDKGVVIQSIEKNSTELNAGLSSGMIITAINDKPINSMKDFSLIATNLFSDSKVQEKLKITTDKGEFIFLKSGKLEFTVGEISKSKIKTGLDLSGGARALIKPQNITLSMEETNELIAIMQQRFNIYGIKDITIKPVTDLGGNNYILIEIAGATPADLASLVSSQGKFEAKIGNETVFIGGEGIHVERAGQYAGIEGCYESEQSPFCRFRFPITISEKDAKKHAEITSKLDLSAENPEYLSEKLNLYVDDQLADSLFISKDLKGREATQISIQGSGVGSTKQDAFKDAEANMKKLQTILITGSLPYKLEIVKLDTISPVLGKEFFKNLILLGLSVFVLVSVLIFIKYRKIKLSLAVILTMFSEVFITLGIAALIRWNLDAPSIAGIIAGMGTGVNDQIVLIDEYQSDRETLSIKERVKRAFFIILGAFFTIFAAMIPLFWAGAGMLRGFALTTIIGVTVGILITRPAFADILKRISE